MPPIDLPAEVAGAIREFRTCEFTTLAKDGTPITWPTLPFYDPAAAQFIITTSIALPQKVFNIRRNGRVSLLFSEPRASGLAHPPAVLVQGDAVAPDEIVTSIKGTEQALAMVFQRQPGSAIYSRRPMRWLADWYYMRLIMTISPRRITWWPAGLLCHAHDDLLWHQTSFGVRGTLARDDRGWLFQPRALLPGIQPDPLSLLRFILSCRRSADAYLKKRGLARPQVPWDEIVAVKRAALHR